MVRVGSWLSQIFQNHSLDYTHSFIILAWSVELKPSKIYSYRNLRLYLDTFKAHDNSEYFTSLSNVNVNPISL